MVCQIVAGLGGVGKTQLAANLAHRWWQQQRVDLLVWVTATSRTAVLTRYAHTAADVTGVEDPDPVDGALRFLAWLTRTNHRWLIVLDDLTDPADLQGLWPPSTAAGHTVVTTRRRDAALLAGRTVVEVDVFTPNQGLDYLHGKLGDQPHRLDEASELADDLGRLPLALAQAAAYIADQDLTCAGYRRRLTRRRLHTLRPPTLPDDQQAAVADTWALSIDLADGATGGIAGVLLELTAVLDPNGIPTPLFTTAAVTGYCTTRTGQPVTDDDANDALRALHRLSLITVDPATTDTRLIRVHAMLQRVVRENTSIAHKHDLAVTAADAINEVWPEHELDAGTAQPLRANTTTLHHYSDQHLWTTADGVHPILFRAGTSLGTTGLVAAARDYFLQLHTIATQHLGPDHRDTLATRHQSAQWRGETGDPTGAGAATKELLADMARILGPDHEGTLTTRNNLAYWRGQAGDPVGAAAATEELLIDIVRALGRDHPLTLTTRDNLAGWRGKAGDPAGAAAATEDLLLDMARVLGPDHSDTLTTRDNLARWQAQAGDPASAVTTLEDLLVDRLRVLGPDHPHTLTTRNNLALWRGRAGDPAGAVAALHELLDDMLRVLGPDHPMTLTTRHHLASSQGRAGNPASAVTAYQELFIDRLRVLGPDHPDVLITRNNLAHWRGQAGDAAGAVAALQELLDDMLRVLGPDHPDTIFARSNLSGWARSKESEESAPRRGGSRPTP
ncbi:hypothetical protein GCM10018962_02730 [Dactylosporangium matsuzakiense]|uniref:Tetratricopeptide repeat protein n=1 Tax=Dactylosporangium matsuzakiense TaxID=53360 RepID=A0A9W6KHR6_9ACTN|nr:tetratricopeptide repeat protein [Dactylosporangium matsuzakiense]